MKYCNILLRLLFQQAVDGWHRWYQKRSETVMALVLLLTMKTTCWHSHHSGSREWQQSLTTYTASPSHKEKHGSYWNAIIQILMKAGTVTLCSVVLFKWQCTVQHMTGPYSAFMNRFIFPVCGASRRMEYLWASTFVVFVVFFLMFIVFYLSCCTSCCACSFFIWIKLAFFAATSCFLWG